MKVLKLLIISFILYFPQYIIGQEQINSSLSLETGTVTFIFEKDSLMKKYWLKKSIFVINGKEYFLIPSVEDVVVKLDLFCNGKDTILSYRKRNPISIFDVKQYRDININNNEYSRHIGGDTYLIDNNLIGIVFHITAYVVKFNEKPCEKFAYGKFYSCPVPYDKVFYPIAVAIDILKATSLTRSEIRKLKIKKIKNINIEIGVCD